MRGVNWLEVRFDDVTMAFDDKIILDKINFTLPSQQLISFLGPSGSGKSTTLYLISGLLEATSGDIYFGDRNVTHLDPTRRKVGLVFQNYALYPHLTVADNIMFPLKMAKVPKQERLERMEEMAQLSRIEDQLDKFPRQLSGGQQQRVAISRALAKSPEILLMDEPLSNLDARLRVEMREEIRRIQQETGVTTVFVTHDQEEALSIADSVMVLDGGKIQQISDPITLYEKPNNTFVAKFIGSPMINMFTRFSNALNPEATLLEDNAWVEMGVRSEGFRLATPENYLLQGTIEKVVQVGKERTIHVKSGQERFVLTNIEEPLEAGQIAYFNVAPQYILLFDGNGRRIEREA
ncbi:multiple sugar transport system ATP-binding protein [Dolosicoccus paucivorans]|nr:multiple sugar transport system ATP-binding protein [Dolosicoccus paucivorans]